MGVPYYMRNPLHKFCIEAPNEYETVMVKFVLGPEATYDECIEAFKNFLRGVGYVPQDEEEIERAY